jgi:phosphatidylglycerol---prolipoprotein diacylglyceryl transferase
VPSRHDIVLLVLDTHDAHRIAPYNNLALYPESTRFQPLFLYESLANLLGFILIFWISRRFEKQLRNGDLFLLYLIWYPLVRFCLEFFRTDSWFFPGTPFNVVHILSAMTAVTAITLLIARNHRVPRAEAVTAGGSAPAVEAEAGSEGGD